MEDKDLEKETESEVIDKDGKEIKPKKISFFKKVWYSISKFEKYVPMSLEGTGSALKYLFKIILIFVFIIACIGIYSANINLNEFINNIKNNAPDFTYKDGTITLKEEAEPQTYTISDTNMNFGKIIIDLNTEDENVISEYENMIKNDSETNNVGFIILNNKVIQVAKLAGDSEGESRLSLSYDEVMQRLFGKTDVTVTKSNIIQFLEGNGRASILFINFASYFIAYFIIYFCSGLIYALILAFIAFITVKILKIALTFSKLFAMSIYAFTLSNILNIIYFVVNYFAGITIKYFDIAYIIIAYVYLITVIFLIKTDFLRKQENEVKKKNEEEKKETDGQEQI